MPDTLPAQAAALRDLLTGISAPVGLSAIASAFEGKATPKRRTDIQGLLETLEALGQAVEQEAGLWRKA